MEITTMWREYDSELFIIFYEPRYRKFCIHRVIGFAPHV